MGSAAANDPKLVRALEDGIHNLGWAVSADDAYQMVRGLRTLPTRLARHGESGLAVAAWLAQQPEVVQVLHPALPGAPGHELWRRHFDRQTDRLDDLTDRRTEGVANFDAARPDWPLHARDSGAPDAGHFNRHGREGRNLR